MAKQEVAVKIRTDDANLLAPPPMRVEWPPVVLPDQTGNHNVRVAARESPSQVQFAPGPLDRVVSFRQLTLLGPCWDTVPLRVTGPR